jgi:GNAT superfamily N-acetyltransferase
MMPVPPDLLVRPLQPAEHPTLLAALNERLQTTPYSDPFDAALFYTQLEATNPPALYPVRWQHHARLCAWRARRLEGFVDAAVGHDHESLDRPEYQPIGLIRFMWLTTSAEQSPAAAHALLRAAEHFWRAAGVGYVKAFHYSTGYPNFQAGLGALPGDWATIMRLLMAEGYQFCERFYALSRPLSAPIAELTPLADLNLLYSGTPADRTYQIYRRIDWVGLARLVSVTQADLPIAKVIDLQIDPQWRGMNIGKWLLRRLINDATLQGKRELLAHLPYSRHEAISLFNQQGFSELNYRGYTLEKTLTE